MKRENGALISPGQVRALQLSLKAAFGQAAGTRAARVSSRTVRNTTRLRSPVGGSCDLHPAWSRAASPSSNYSQHCGAVDKRAALTCTGARLLIASATKL